MKRIVYQVDSFTKTPFTGNPAGVVINADGLDESQMLKIARELNNSETAFVFNETPGDHDVHIRFFTPKVEVPMCGHATIAAHYALAMENNLPSQRVIQKIAVGCLPVDIIKIKDDYEIVMTQGDVHFTPPLNNEIQLEMLDALGLTDSDLIPGIPIEIVSTGHSKIFVPLKNFAKLQDISPNFPALLNVSQKINCNGFLVFTPSSPEPDCLVSARMFAPALGIDEDPVNGSSGGALGAFLIKHSLLSTSGKSRVSFRVFQGFVVNREGSLKVEVVVDKNGVPQETKIVGNAVIVFRTTITI